LAPSDEFAAQATLLATIDTNVMQKTAFFIDDDSTISHPHND
jgi:hypothetical protein